MKTIIVLVLMLSAIADARPQPSKAARTGFVEYFNERAATEDLPFLVKFGKLDTTLSIVVTKGSCTKPLLVEIIKAIRQNLINVGFTLVDCSSDETISVKP